MYVHTRHESTNPNRKEQSEQLGWIWCLRETSKPFREAHSVYKAGHAVPGGPAVHRQYFAVLSSSNIMI